MLNCYSAVPKCLGFLPVVTNTSAPPLSPVPRKHLEDVLVLFPEVFVEVSVQHRVDARVGQAQDVADAVDQGMAVAAVAHQGLQNLGAKVLQSQIKLRLWTNVKKHGDLRKQLSPTKKQNFSVDVQ